MCGYPILTFESCGLVIEINEPPGIKNDLQIVKFEKLYLSPSSLSVSLSIN